MISIAGAVIACGANGTNGGGATAPFIFCSMPGIMSANPRPMMAIGKSASAVGGPTRNGGSQSGDVPASRAADEIKFAVRISAAVAGNTIRLPMRERSHDEKVALPGMAPNRRKIGPKIILMRSWI